MSASASITSPVVDSPEDHQGRWRVAGSAAMNHAMAMASGDLVTHLDDDEHLPRRLERLVSFMMDTQCDAAWHPFWYETDEGTWELNEATTFSVDPVTTSAIIYRRWLTRIEWDTRAHLLIEPGDWHRFRRFKFLGADIKRYAEPLLRHYRERAQVAGSPE